MEKFKSSTKQDFSSESIESEKKPIKMKRPQQDTRKNVVSSPPIPSHISDTLEAIPSPNHSGGEDITFPMKDTPKGGEKKGKHSHG